MDFSTDLLIVAGVVAGAVLWAARAAYRTWKAQGTCSSCGSSGECPVAKNPELLADLAAGKDGKPGQAEGFASCKDLADVLEKKTTGS
jgi:hypothetical protein